MGTYSKGILGGFSGTVGTVIGSNWKGIDYMRSQPVKSKKTATQAQIDQRAKFSLMVLFLDVLTAYLEMTFKNYAVQMTPNNAALSWNLDSAITGKSPNFSINYPKVSVSRGKLLNGASPAAVIKGSTAVFTWIDNSGISNATANDVALPLVYCPALMQCSFTDNVVRSAQEADVDVSAFTGQVVETWLAFISPGGTDATPSVFLGELTV